jgi:hypothetical protein
MSLVRTPYLKMTAKPGFFLVAVILSVGTCLAQRGNIDIGKVSVLANGHVEIHYLFTAPAPIVNANVKVFRNVPGTIFFGEISSFRTDLPVLFNGLFTDNTADTGGHPAAYYLVVLDETGTTIATSPVHSTIFLTTPAIDLCLKRLNLSWNNYSVTTSAGEPVQLPTHFDSVRVQVSTDGSQFTTRQTFRQMPPGIALQQFSLPGLSQGIYFFRIQAFGQGVTTNSNTRMFHYQTPVLSDFKVDNVTVFENREINVSFSASGDTEAFMFYVYRSLDTGGRFERVGSLAFPGVFTDQPDLLHGPWFYRIEAYYKTARCPDWAFATPDFSSVYLKTRPGTRLGQVIFEWKHYFPPERRFSYQLKMKTGLDVWQLAPGFYDSGQGYFSKVITPDETEAPSTFRLDATDMDNPLLVSSSNHLVLKAEPTVFIPNAFRPTSQYSENQVFKPIFSGFTPTDYQLIIFNRWGQEVFSTTDPAKAWDGRRADGRFVGPGVFSYIVQYKTPDGQTRQTKGVVALVE